MTAHARASDLVVPPIANVPARSPRPAAPAPSGKSITARTKVRLVHHMSFGLGLHGTAGRTNDGGAVICLADHVVHGLHTGDREAWLTIFHEAGHVIFGDIFTGSSPAREARAEAFAEFMLSYIERCMRMGPAHERRKQIEREEGARFSAELKAMGWRDEPGHGGCTAEQLRAALAAREAQVESRVRREVA